MGPNDVEDEALEVVGVLDVGRHSIEVILASVE
jgi:hypothetical protein